MKTHHATQLTAAELSLVAGGSDLPPAPTFDVSPANGFDYNNTPIAPTAPMQMPVMADTGYVDNGGRE